MEAVILNFLDDLDSKINGVRTHIEREPDSESAWTQYHKHYDRYFFKGVGHTVLSDKADPGQGEEKIKSPDPVSGEPSGRQGSRFSNTLGEQLKNKDLNLLVKDIKDNSDE
jgi:3'-5' exoribonuclease